MVFPNTLKRILKRIPLVYPTALALRRVPRRLFPLYPNVDESLRIDSGNVEGLSDRDLAELNHLLDWNCYTIDLRGRRFGNIAHPGKRSRPEVIPDPRIIMLNDLFELSDKSVLEFGCFEGVHTAGLCHFARSVIAVDARIENVVKTLVRCGMYGFHPEVFRCNLEDPLDLHRLGRVDVILHIGVLYHLCDPVTHLAQLQRWCGTGLLLDTHVAEDSELAESYEVGGETYRYRRYDEGGMKDPFSGVYDHAKWLTLPAIVTVLERNGFVDVDVVEKREERNGVRVLLFAKRCADTNQ